MSEKKAKVVKPEVQAKFGPSLLVFLLVTAVILVGILVLGLDAHIPIVIAAMIVAVYGIILHVPFKDLEHAMIKTISESVPVLLLICIVGMLIGSWMSAGTVPVIIYVGLELLRPSIFLAVRGDHVRDPVYDDRFFLDDLLHDRRCLHGHLRRSGHPPADHGRCGGLRRLLRRQAVPHLRLLHLCSGRHEG